MTEDVSVKLDEIFNARAEREAAHERRVQENERIQDENLQQFLKLKEAIIRPTLEVFVENLKGRGHRTKIVETVIEDGQKRSAKVSIGIQMCLDGKEVYRAAHEYPHLTMSLDRAGRKVDFYASTMKPGSGGMAGGEGSVTFEELTAELINSKVLKVMAAVYR